MHCTGVCLLSVSCSSTPEDIPHILVFCEALQPTREKLRRFSNEYCKPFPPVRKLVHQFCHSTNPQFCQFLLDCSVLPPVILAAQLHGSEVLHHLFHITRTWCYTLHKERMKMLGRWNHFWPNQTPSAGTTRYLGFLAKIFPILLWLPLFRIYMILLWSLSEMNESQKS